jgi:hypothetical protein
MHKIWSSEDGEKSYCDYIGYNATVSGRFQRGILFHLQDAMKMEAVASTYKAAVSQPRPH